MRTLDQTPPAVTVDTHPQPWGRGRLVVALERLPQAPYTWDDPDPTVVWAGTGIPAGSILIEPFDNLTAWYDESSVSSIQPGGRTGSALRIDNTGFRRFDIPAGQQALTYTIGFAYKVSDLSATRTIVQFRQTSVGVSLRANTNGSLEIRRGTTTILGTSAVGIVTVNTWVYIEVVLTHGNSPNGAATVRANGTTVIGPLTGIDTNNGLIDGSMLTQIALSGAATSGPQAWFDDLYLSSGTTLEGPVTIPPFGTGGDTGLVWDAPFIGSGFTDVWCDMSALSIVHGEPDPTDMYRMSACQLELVDPDGRYRSRTPDGQLVYYAPGRRLAIWWQDDDATKWWLFSGLLATWRERFDRTVAIEAYSGEYLGQAPGVSWTAGTAGQLLSARVAAILTAAGYTGQHRSDLGLVALRVPEPADTPPIDMVRQAAWSGGGIVYTDVDDTLVIRDRLWRDGRSDQATVPVLSDNVCDTNPDAVVVWEPQAADDDLRLAGTVRLENTADPALTAVATSAGAPPGYVDPRIVFTHPGPDLWTTQPEGDALAAHILAERQIARMALGSAALYMHDRRFDYWDTAMNLRLGDLVRFVHDDYGTLYDLTAILTTVRHQISPDTWLVTLATSPAVDYTPIEAWDQTRFYWDDTDPLAVWR